eukprot:GEMP01021398.1.p1 GENE.GEMP01021398.1~~GEMP01021398.1.p1  ORF type:complete len:515 (+),score=94.86 GEMP01021398.1:58-1545(+)
MSSVVPRHEYDLLDKLAPYMDRHFLLKLFTFLKDKIYEEKSMLRAVIDLLVKTNMLDYVTELYEEIGEDPPAELEIQKSSVIASISSARESVMTFLSHLEDHIEYEKIKKFKSLDDLCDEYSLEDTVLDDMFDYAQLIFKCGNYLFASKLLAQYRDLILLGEGGDSSQGDQANDRQNYLMSVAKTGRDSKKYVISQWGLLASLILTDEWKEAADSACLLDHMIATAYETIDTRTVVNSYGKLEQRQVETCKNEALQQRTWFSHWTLFILFKIEWGSDNVKKDMSHLVQTWTKLVDIFLNEKSMSVISLSSPHLLRYVAALLILYNKKFKHLMRDIVTVIHSEADNYSDPITNFLLALYVHMDFDDAQLQLQNCKAVCEVDFFLSDHYPTLLENARLLIFESYCRVHQYIDITMIAEKLSMEPDAAEVWIVNLIQNAKLQARIDSENNRVLMAKENPSVYQQVIDKTKNMHFRTTLVQANAANVAKLAVEKKPLRY